MGLESPNRALYFFLINNCYKIAFFQSTSCVAVWASILSIGYASSPLYLKVLFPKGKWMDPWNIQALTLVQGTQVTSNRDTQYLFNLNVVFCTANLGSSLGGDSGETVRFISFSPLQWMCTTIKRLYESSWLVEPLTKVHDKSYCNRVPNIEWFFLWVSRELLIWGSYIETGRKTVSII